MKVYDMMDAVVFEGTVTECEKFCTDKMQPMRDGRKIFRKWMENGKCFIDAGDVFYTTEEIFKNVR